MRDESHRDDGSETTQTPELQVAWEQLAHLPTPERLEMGWQRLANDIGHAEGSRVMAMSHREPASLRGAQRRSNRVRLQDGLLRHRFWIGTLTAAACAAGFSVWHMANAHVAQPVRELASAAASRTTVTLRDGTRVILGPDSHLRVPADFGRSVRTVELDGEAYFAVVHDAKHPFAVHAGRVIVQDVGTEFDVRAYADEPHVQVAVAQGIVALRTNHQTRDGAQLLAGDLAVIDSTNAAVTHHADVTALTVWTQGGLAFDEMPLRDVLRTLSRTYALHITLADSTLGDKRVTSTFANESVDEILDAVTRIVGAHYQRTGQTVVVRPGVTRTRQEPTQPVVPLRTALSGPSHE